MSFGQFSATSCRRTKAEQLEIAGEGIVWSRKAGHNRLHFRTADGAEHFMLHATVIASINADRTRLTLNDGGWATITTRKAWGDAADAFKLQGMHAWGNRPKSDHVLNGLPFDRSITVSLPDFKALETAPPAIMLRAVVNGETSLEVAYRDGEIVSSNGDKIAAPVSAIVCELYRILDCAKASRGFIGWRHDPIDYKNSIKIFKGAWDCSGGCRGRHVYVGCHEFATTDLRATLKRFTLEHPEQAAVGRKLYLRSKRETKKLGLVS